MKRKHKWTKYNAQAQRIQYDLYTIDNVVVYRSRPFWRKTEITMFPRSEGFPIVEPIQIYEQ